MKRLSITGSSMISSGRSEQDLKESLVRLGVSSAYDEAGVKELYFKICLISGSWAQNEESKASSSVANGLKTTGQNLAAVAALLSGHNGGVQTTDEIQTTNLVARMLALNPALRRDPEEFIAEFRQSADLIGQACMVAYADLSQRGGRDGRDAFFWYDEFTALLLETAQKANVLPALGHDFINDAHGGWLFDAAQELELFLYPPMRSPSVSACAKRLERSLKRLREPYRQNPRPAA